MPYSVLKIDPVEKWLVHPRDTSLLSSLFNENSHESALRTNVIADINIDPETKYIIL